MRVGILGGGQLAQMMAKIGPKLDMSFQFLCPEADACSAPYGELLTADYQDENAQKALADWADVITYEFESIPVSTVKNLEQQSPLYPSSLAIQTAGDRLIEKTLFNTLSIPTANFADVTSLATLIAAVEKIGLPAILKTRRDGYDGKGQFVLRQESQIEEAWQALAGVPCILESMVHFDREVSIIAVRARTGDVVFYPLAENSHRDGILRLSVTLDQDPIQPKAEALIKKLLEEMDYVGVLTLELFQVGDTLMANEMAPRVHNTGHWSIEGAPASQFENHLRAVGGLPLVEVRPFKHSAMINLIGSVLTQAQVDAVSGASLHVYGKDEKPGRKLGHITLVEDAIEHGDFDTNLKQLLALVG